MRKWLLIGGTLTVVAGAFALVLWEQRGTRIAVQTDGDQFEVKSHAPASTTQYGSISRTEGAWMTIPDPKTGLPQVRFRGSRFTPQEGDKLVVDRPEVEFYIGDERDKIVRVTGKVGVIAASGEGPRIRANLQTTPMKTPTRGELREVVVEYFGSPQSIADRKAELTMNLPCAYFDSELLEIATAEYVNADGKKVPGNEAPIRVSGEAFEFSGQGLYIRWDEANKRLKSMVVYKGDQLVVKRASGDLVKARAQRPGDAFAGMLASTDPMAAAGSVAKSADEVKAAIYRGVFHDGVVVTQGEQTLARAPEMQVDFRTDNPGGANAPGPARPQKKPLATARPTGGSAEAGSASVGPTKSDAPIVIRWGGQLTVDEAPEKERLKPASANDSIVRFVGTEQEPVRLYDKGSEIVAAAAAYATESRRAWVDGAEGRPVQMISKDKATNKEKATLLTPRLVYAEVAGRGKATLLGPSSASLVSPLGKGQAEEHVKATWSDSAEVLFTGDAEAQSIEQLSLNGNVTLQSERLRRFEAGSLVLGFGPGVGKNKEPQIRQLTATKNVNCVIAAGKRGDQAIQAQVLKLTAAKDGERDYLSMVEASGGVVAGDAKEQIRAESIQAVLPPDVEGQKSMATAGTPELAGLRQLVAVGDVQVTGTKDLSVKADRLQVKRETGKSSWILLEGRPAVVKQGQTATLSGPFIEVDTATDKAVVSGGGMLVMDSAKLTDAKSGKAAGSPVEITWTGDGSLSASSNLASVAGNVVIRYADAEGRQNEAMADRVNITLATKPGFETTKKAEQSDFAVMEGRYPSQITLLPSEGKDVRVQSLAPGANGTIQRQLNLFGSRIDVYLSPESVQRIEIPATTARPGRMLYMASAMGMSRPAKLEDPMKNKDLPGSTAFAWHDKLVYDRAASQILMSGAVVVRNEPPSPGARGFEVEAQDIIVDLSPEKGAPSANADAREVHKLTLKGSPVKMVREDIDMTAPLVEVEPAANLVTATGTPQSLVYVNRGPVLGSLQKVEINAKTNEMKFYRVTGAGRR